MLWRLVCFTLPSRKLSFHSLLSSFISAPLSGVMTSFIHRIVFVIRFFGIGFSFGIHEYSKRSSQTLINYYCQ